MDGFLIGGCLYVLQKINLNKQFNFYYLFSLVSIVAGIFFTGNAKGYNPFLSTVGFTLIAIVFAGLIQTATNNSSGILPTIFKYKWLRFTGKISYGLYIFHWLVLRALEPRFENLFIKSGYFNNEAANDISLFFCLAISYLISIISYFYFESYFLKRKVR